MRDCPQDCAKRPSRGRARRGTATHVLSLAALLLVSLFHGHALADIESPGDHPSYGMELQGHLVVQWHDEGYDEAFGPGFRVYFPVIPSGPIGQINNSLALGLGVDLTFSEATCVGQDCDNWQLWLPLSVQWNFYFSRDFSMFPELGLAFQYVEYDGPLSDLCNGRICDDDDLDVEPVFWLGARYRFAPSATVSLRIGTPSLILGVSLLL